MASVVAAVEPWLGGNAELVCADRRETQSDNEYDFHESFNPWFHTERAWYLELNRIWTTQDVVFGSDTKLFDHTVMEKLHEMQGEMQEAGLRLELVGLEQHQALSTHSDAARKRGMARMRRITIVAESSLEDALQRECIARGATGFTAMPSRGIGRHNITNGVWQTESNIRLETIVPYEVCDDILKYLKENILNRYRATVCVETIEVILAEQFTSPSSDAEKKH